MSARPGMAEILEILKTQGPLKAGALVQNLGVSRATLAKRLAGVSSGLVALGKTRNLRYALLKPLTDLASVLPFFRVDGLGSLKPLGKLMVLHGGAFAVEPGAQIFTALPPEISDMAPQGFMGRAFAKQHAPALNLPQRLADWSDDHVLKAVARRGEDLPGNLILGIESAERWQGLPRPSESATTRLSPQNTKRSSFVKLAGLALNDQPAGSSAGGERPKFSVFLKDRHQIVKFAGPLHHPAQRRWRDLLFCEATAGEVLALGGVPTVHAGFSESGDHAFLEIERFDRMGANGRRPYLSLAAVDGFLFGERDTWSLCVERLNRAGLLADADAGKIKLTDAFARLIFDSDRHFYNLGLLPEFATEHSLIPNLYRPAPVFDKLPMLFSPVESRIVARDPLPPIPGAEVIGVWNDAVALAKIFWEKVAREKSLSAEFRKIAKGCFRMLKGR